MWAHQDAEMEGEWLANLPFKRILSDGLNTLAHMTRGARFRDSRWAAHPRPFFTFRWFSHSKSTPEIFKSLFLMTHKAVGNDSLNRTSFLSANWEGSKSAWTIYYIFCRTKKNGHANFIYLETSIDISLGLTICKFLDWDLCRKARRNILIELFFFFS